MSRLERIVAALGGVLFEGGRRALVRGPGHGKTDRSVSLMETEDGRIWIHCFSPRDDWRAVRHALVERGLLDEPPSQTSSEDVAREIRPVIVQPAQEDRVARARRIWAEGRAITGTVAERYLRGRAIALDAARSAALRFHPRMTSLDDCVRRPALLAALTDDEGAVQGVQATLLSAHGAAKAALATPRRVIGRLMGGSVRLQQAGSTLVVAEGVETALSASAALGLPAWSALTAGNLAAFEPPLQVSRLVIAPDSDAAGRQAAALLQARLAQTIEVDFAWPPEGFKDWNDWARAKAVR